MPSSAKPAALPPPSGPVVSKAKALWNFFAPELPDFPLSADAVEATRGKPGVMPKTLKHFANILAAERAARSE